jgi:hypothetical protein
MEASQATSSPIEQKRRQGPPWGRQGRIVGVVALPLVVVWCAAATWISLRWIRDLEIAASMAYVISMGLGGKSPDTVFDPRVTVATRLVWVAVMWLIGLWTAVAAIWGLRGKGAARWMMRVAGVLILLGTGATFAGIEILIRYGGFPPMPAFTIALICSCQAVLGVLLLAVTRKRSPATSTP